MRGECEEREGSVRVEEAPIVLVPPSQSPEREHVLSAQQTLRGNEAQKGQPLAHELHVRREQGEEAIQHLMTTEEGGYYFRWDLGLLQCRLFCFFLCLRRTKEAAQLRAKSSDLARGASDARGPCESE